MSIWADEMIGQYEKHLNELIKMRNRLESMRKIDKHEPLYKLDLTQVNSMIKEMQFVLQWLETGRDPNNYRGADSKGIYQKRAFISMDIIPDITDQLEEGPKQLYMSAEEKIILADIFSALSHRERQCYILHEAGQMSMSEVAAELGLSKWTARGYIDRAKKKIENIVLKESS